MKIIRCNGNDDIDVEFLDDIYEILNDLQESGYFKIE